MKKNWFLLCLCVVLLSGCSKKVEPQISNVQNICEMASMECYFHDVAKEETVGSWLGIMDKKCWIEYTGTVKLGVDLEQVDMEVKRDKVLITIPEIKVLSSNLDKDSVVVIKEDSILASDTFAAEMLDKAQKNMEEEAMKNDQVLLQAEERVKLMLQKYVNTVSEASGVEYTIEWKKAEE